MKKSEFGRIDSKLQQWGQTELGVLARPEERILKWFAKEALCSFIIGRI